MKPVPVLPALDPKVQAFVCSNPAIQMLAQLDGGRTITTLAEKYPQVVEGVKKTGAKGKLVLTLEIRPDGKGEVQTVEVLGKVDTKIPERGSRATTFFVTEENLLSRRDPNQQEIDFPAAAKAAAAN